MFAAILKILHMEKQPKYTFKYNGDLEYIDITTLISSQLHFLEMLNEIQREIAPEIEFKTKIKYLPKGSWQYEFMFSLFPGLVFGSDSVDKIKKIISAASSILNLKKLLKGKEPIKIEQSGNGIIVHIQGDNNQVQFYTLPAHEFKLMKNKKIDNSANKMIDDVDKDNSIDGIEIFEDKDSILVDIKRDDFEKTKKTNSFLEESKTLQEPINNVELIMLYNKDGKYDLYQNGSRITPYHIEDPEFNDKLSKGNEGFYSGNRLFVDMSILKEYNKVGDVYINKSYSIIKVHSNTQRLQDSQSNLDL
jgi:hypothetical protein